MGSKLDTKHYFISILILIVLLVLVIIKPGKSFKFQDSTAQFAEHGEFTKLLEKHVNANGQVDYLGFQKDSIVLNAYLSHLRKSPPNDSVWPVEEQIAYWINTYNAFTIKLVIDHYPVSSIKDIGSSIQIPFINSPWDISFIEIGDQLLTLNNIEHRILRKEFAEPRIHFAIVCASISCPKLRNEAFIALKLDEQLNEQAIGFINDPSKNEISADEIKISKIFQWFGGDFKKDGTLIDYLNQFSDINISKNAKTRFLDYNWGLNDRP